MCEATMQRGLLVDAEIMPGLVSKQRDDLRELARRWNRMGFLHVRGFGRRSVKPCRNEFGNVSDRRDRIDGARRDRAERHAIEFGFLRILSDNETAFFLDRDKTDAAIGAGPRQDDADGLLATSFGERGQEKVERQSRTAPFSRLRQPQ